MIASEKIYTLFFLTVGAFYLTKTISEFQNLSFLTVNYDGNSYADSNNPENNLSRKL